jgi:hypothetical protein
MAGTNFSAVLIRNNSVLSIKMVDDGFIPPFEAGELWKIIRGNDIRKTIQENEMTITCDGLTNQTGDLFGTCTLRFPFEQFKKAGNMMVFKAEGVLADSLNRYFNDSAYLSMQRNAAYISAYNTRRLFFFGIDESLIQK